MHDDHDPLDDPEGGHLDAGRVAGRRFTHRLTAEERDTGRIDHLPDLLAFTELVDFGDTLQLRDREDRVEIVCDDDGLALVGPSGWLAEHVAGELLAFVLEDEALVVGGVDGPVRSGDAEIAALRAAFDAHSSGEVVPLTFGTMLLGEVLDAEPELFAGAAPPLGELLAAAGLGFGAGFVHEAGVDVRTALERNSAAFLAIESTALRGPCCRSAFTLAREAVDGAPDAATDDEVAVALAHAQVARAVAQYVRLIEASSARAAALAERLGEGVGTTRAIGLFLRSVLCEHAGDIASARSLVEAAHTADPDHHAVLDQFARDRALAGDLDAAIRARQHLRLADDPELDALRALRPVRRSAAGRNDPCPCGSGRKYKACCIDKPPLLDAAGHAAALIHKLLVATLRPEHLADVEDTFDLAFEPYEDDPERADDIDAAEQLLAESGLLVHWLAFEGGIAAELLRLHGPFLPEQERVMLEDWVARPLSLYDVRERRDGHGVDLRDLQTGVEHGVVGLADPIDVGRRGRSRAVLARLGRIGDTDAVIGVPLLVDDDQREELLEQLDAGIDVDELVFWWVETQLGPPPQD